MSATAKRSCARNTVRREPSGGAATGGSFAGSITAALFLNRFVDNAKAWAHFDVYGWTPSAKPARPEGGECQAARALYALLKERYGTT